MATSHVEEIRRLVRRNTDISNHMVRSTLALKGINVDDAKIDSVKRKFSKQPRRSWQTRVANPKSLKRHIIEVLTGRKEGCTAAQLVTLIRKNGYVSDDATFPKNLKKQLRDLVRLSQIKRQDGKFLMESVQVEPAIQSTQTLSNGMLNPKLLVEVNRIAARFGGLDHLQSYITTLQELRKT